MAAVKGLTLRDRFDALSIYSLLLLLLRRLLFPALGEPIGESALARRRSLCIGEKGDAGRALLLSEFELLTLVFLENLPGLAPYRSILGHLGGFRPAFRGLPGDLSQSSGTVLECLLLPLLEVGLLGRAPLLPDSLLECRSGVSGGGGGGGGGAAACDPVSDFFSSLNKIDSKSPVCCCGGGVAALAGGCGFAGVSK